jgi:hypothetical protein
MTRVTTAFYSPAGCLLKQAATVCFIRRRVTYFIKQRTTDVGSENPVPVSLSNTSIQTEILNNTQFTTFIDR